MKLSNAKPSKNLLIHLTGTLFFFLFILSAAAEIRAQGNINDDLAKPSTTPSNPATRRPKTGKTAKPKPPVRKPVARRVEIAPAPAPKPAPVPKPAPAPKPAPVAAVVIAEPTQTPAEIIERFMNFQQSASVTNKDWESVVKQTTAILQTNAGDKTAKAQFAVAQGELAFNRGDYSSALVQFNAASMALPDSALPYYGIGRVYLNTKQASQAENAFERAIKIDKKFALGYKGLGDALTAQGKTKKAEDYYKQAARADEARNTPTGSPTGNAGNNSNLSGGGNASQTGATESATDRELKIARDYTSQKKWQMSLDKLLPMIANNPSAEVFIAVGDNYFGMQAWLSAQQAYRKASEINPNLAVAYYRLGMVLFETNEFQAAVDAFEKSLILDQNGTTINRPQARKMADKANEKVREMMKDGKKKSFLGIGY